MNASDLTASRIGARVEWTPGSRTYRTGQIVDIPGDETVRVKWDHDTLPEAQTISFTDVDKLEWLT